MYKKIVVMFVICIITVSYAQNLVPYRIGDKWGYAEYGTKKIIIPVQYDYAAPFYGEIAKIKFFDKWAVIDKNGNQTTPFKYSYVDDFKDGLTHCISNGKYGYLNQKGIEVVPTIYTSISYFSVGHYEAFIGDTTYYFDDAGNQISEDAVQQISNQRDELSLVKVDGKYDLKDISGKIITKRQYTTISAFKNNCAVVSLDKKYGMIDKNGNEIVPLQYDYIENIEDGAATFELNNKYGIIDITGKVVVQPIYDDLNNIGEKRYTVKLNNQRGIIDNTGKEIVPLGLYDGLELFTDGISKVRSKVKYGFIDIQGNVIIPLQYEDANSFQEGLAGVKVNGKWGFVDQAGKMVIGPKYNYITFGFKDGIIGVADGFTYYPTTYIDKTGKEYVDKYQAPKAKKYPEVSIWKSEIRKIKSYTNNEEYSLFIYMPRNYYETNKTYPVLYLLDADYTFGIARDAIESMTFGQEVPEMIIVGVAYGKTFDDWFQKRIRDLTPTNDTTAKMFPGGGGCDKFYNFIKDELIGYADKNFRVVPNERTLVGYSFGGLFGFYTIFKSPELFNRYLIISPSLWWDNKLAFNWESEFAQTNLDMKAKICLTVGGEESMMITNIDKMVNILKTRNYPSLDLTYWQTAGQSHFSVFPTAFADGMKAISKD